MPALQSVFAILFALSVSLAPPGVFAGEAASTPQHAGADLDEVTIIGHRRDPADVPGSVHVLNEETLKVFLQGDVMRVLRTVPGVYLQEEEGYGLRPNIGIRGSGLDRSARVALLEDGVLIAPAPYSAPAAYYFPTQRRMHAVEVLKGPASIAVGPRTTGGAINLVSTPIPDEFGGSADLRIGRNNNLDALLQIGNRGERFSWLAETVQARTDGFKTIDGPAGADMGPTGYDIEDYLVKLQFDSAPGSDVYQSLRIKAGKTDQRSDETYLGLTEEDFRLQPKRRYAASAGDVFRGHHEQLTATYVIDPESNWQGEITAYRNDFSRNWFKLQSVAGSGIDAVLSDPENYSEAFSYLTGTSSPDDALFKRHNNRQYLAEGLQAQINWDLEFGGTAIALTAGGRFHEDEEDRLQKEDGFRMQDSLLVATSFGAPGSNTNRVSSARALSWFLDSEFRSGNWILTPGARFEDIDMQRLDYSTSDPNRNMGPTTVRENHVSVVIPGIGALYVVNDRLRLLGGVHKGFNPPGPGSNASEERSTNFEFGTRFSLANAGVEAIYFLNDYDNLVGTVTASTGGAGSIGDQFDGGQAIVQGLEFSVDTVFEGLSGGIDLPVSLQYTWTAQAEFQNTFESNFDPWGDVEIGDELPYIPEHQLRIAAGLQSDTWGVNAAANYVGDMRTVAGRGSFLAGEFIESHLVFDLVARWRFNDSVTTYLKIDNLLDETYIAARRPAGLRPGLERTAAIGVVLTL